ncbi:hypothetical protein H8697_00855 [[Eubacterium] tenue]|nr:hypothetical protein [[Eubacterium] tenue]MBC8630259.1 hypothetical protein [[Eubacterium] tenue]
MRLKNAVCSPVPIIPNELKGKFEIITGYSLSEREAKIFNVVLSCVVKELKRDNIDFKNLHRIAAIITRDGEFTLAMKNSSTIGTRICLAVYAVERWRRLNYGDNQISIIIAEELCHHYWNIEDEVKVKYKVYNIVKELFPGSTFEQFYTI